MKNAQLPAISESVGDALSAGSSLVHELGTTAVERAGELASTAVHRLSDLPVDRLTRPAQRRLGRRRVRVWRRRPIWSVTIVLAVVVAVAAAVTIRRRRVRTVNDGWAVAGEPNELATAAASVGG